ncbi:hypothetical protein KUTeg_015867 [Tegillarca granosa]|uniref:MAM domain-containing protein n=1 Tax=Tegillarca granosa TaxID=220873 RepID=A0ABQ9ENY8_TEGGR|nr:hypothetical protein KUTeg_015867 [Tegillarca granosa]
MFDETELKVKIPNSYYISFDSTIASRGSKTTLLSPVITNIPNGGCIRFYYHMYGSTMGTLSSGINASSNIIEKWSASGNQNDEWHCKVWSFTSQQNLKIYFEATCGEDIYSIIALDDITLFTVFNRCSECSDLVHTPFTTTSPSYTGSSSGTKTTPTDTTTTAATTKVKEITDTAKVAMIVSGVLVVAVIGTIILAINLGKHRRHLAQNKEINDRMESMRQSQQRPSISSSEKYSDLPDPSSAYEVLRKENAYDYINDRDLPPLPQKPSSSSDKTQFTHHSELPLASISSPNRLLPNPNTSDFGIATDDISISSKDNTEYTNPVSRRINKGQNNSYSGVGNSPDQLDDQDHDYITPV